MTTSVAIAGARPTIRLGLRENAAQFSLLVLVNACVGAMIGTERSILPLLAYALFAKALKSPLEQGILGF